MSAIQMSATSRTILALTITVMLALNASAAPFSQLLRQLRSSDNNLNDVIQDPCQSETPCGWQVYRPVSKAHEYFVTNVCLCPQGSKCQRYEEDLSTMSIVYKCKNETTTQ